MRNERGSVGAVLAALVAVLLAAGIGVGAGWAAGWYTEPEPTHEVLPIPMTTDVPGDWYGKLEPDKDRLAPLGTEFDFEWEERSAGTGVWEYQVPTGWNMETLASGAEKWRPPQSRDLGYAMRTSVVGLGITPLVRLDRLNGDPSFSDVRLIDIDDDELRVTYVYRKHLRYQYTRFFTRQGSSDAFEVTINGRERDRTGMEALYGHVVASVRYVE